MSTYSLIIIPITRLIDNSPFTESSEIFTVLKLFGLGFSLIISLSIIKFCKISLLIIREHKQEVQDKEVNPIKGLVYTYIFLLVSIILLIGSTYNFFILGFVLEDLSKFTFTAYLNLVLVCFVIYFGSAYVISKLELSQRDKKYYSALIYGNLAILSIGFLLVLLDELTIVDLRERSVNLITLIHLYLPVLEFILFCSMIGLWIGIKHLQMKSPDALDLPDVNIDPSGLKLCIYIPAYNVAKTLPNLVERIPNNIEGAINDIIIIDDASPDNTYLLALGLKKRTDRSNMTIYRALTNQRYGGNQKLGYAYSLVKDYDIVVMLHGDAQYAPELIPQIIQPLIKGEADMVYGSRISQDPLKGGMPPIKYIGNRVLTFIENKVLDLNLSEFHSGYRAYSVKALKKIPFLKCTNEFHFDTEIIIQMKNAGLRIKEVSIPTYYGEEVSLVNKMKYGFDVFQELIVYSLHKKKIIFADKYHTEGFKQLENSELEQYLNKHLEVIQ